MTTDAAAVAPDYAELEWRVGRLIDLCTELGADRERIRRAIDRTPPPVLAALGEGRFPPVDPQPYIDRMNQWDRWQHVLEPGTSRCGARITAAASNDLRRMRPEVVGMTTCTLPKHPEHPRGQSFHIGFAIPDSEAPWDWLIQWSWEGPRRELGQVALR